MLIKPKTFFAIHRFESKSYEDSAGKIEIRDPMVQSGLLGEHETYEFGWSDKDSERVICDVITEIKTEIADSPVVVYGAGAHTTQYWKFLSKLNIVAIADKNHALWGKKVKGVLVISPAEIKKFSSKVIVSSRAYEENIKEELLAIFSEIKVFCLYAGSEFKARLARWTNDLIGKVAEFCPDLLVYTPTHVKESLPYSAFSEIRKVMPGIKIVTVWWDYDEENIAAGYIEYEQESLKYADLIIENSNYTRLVKIEKQIPPYHLHRGAEKIFFHPTWFDPKIFYPGLDRDKEIDVAVYGSIVGERGRWIKVLKDYYGDRFKHIGGVSGEEKNPVGIEIYASFLRRTKVVVNTQTYSFRMQCKGKVREAIQCGIFLLEQRNAETEFFVDKIGAAGVEYFSTEQELLESIDRVLDNELWRNVTKLDPQELVFNWTRILLGRL